MSTPPPNDQPVRWRRAFLIGALMPGGWGLMHLARLAPWTTERIYARGFFPWVQGAQAWAQSWFSVSLSELVILGSLGWLFARSVRAVRHWRAGQRSWRNLLARATARAVATAGVLGLVYQLLWGFNHARPTLAQLCDLEVQPVQVQDLRSLVRFLEQRAREDRPADSRRRVERADAALVEAWERTSLELPFLEGPHVRARDAIASRLLTWAGLTGIYSPFTGEAHVNRELPSPSRPFTVCHELAHQRGIAREDEANFVAWLVCNASSDPYQRYSGNLLALSYALVAWYGEQPHAARDAYRALGPEVRGDLVRLWDFWRQRRTSLTEVARQTNDLFLKGQGHEAGAQSYGRMVDLLIAWRGHAAE